MKEDVTTIKVYDKDRKYIKRMCAKFDGLTQPELVRMALAKLKEFGMSELMFKYHK